MLRAGCVGRTAQGPGSRSSDGGWSSTSLTTKDQITVTTFLLGSTTLHIEHRSS
ncbi:hypothetical protein BRADI_1g62986v3 [Brachypodium distachyon]|uniref:Uncharacterized protein n=1 Tax=Brachypodium distachyon TaxID=15368 RepID=A0A2K2DT45_BRADI|nr:hypothetical protein BRADI_1g62986v3 [Brachypodium distachyon]